MPIKKKYGFTSVELAVIIMILIAQVAVLYPIIAKAKEQDRQTTCQANMKECAVALLLYCNDYDATLPSSVIASATPGAQPTQSETINFLTAKGNPYPVISYGVRTKTWPQMLSANMLDNSCIYCPSDSPHTRVSYWYKYAVDLAWRNGFDKEGEFAYNADQVIFYEHTGWHVGDAAGIKDGVKINVAYMDSHVGAIIVRNGPTAYPAAADERTGASAVRLGEPMYYNFNPDTNTRCTGTANYTDPRFYCDSF